MGSKTLDFWIGFPESLPFQPWVFKFKSAVVVLGKVSSVRNLHEMVLEPTKSLATFAGIVLKEIGCGFLFYSSPEVENLGEDSQHPLRGDHQHQKLSF